MTVAAIPRLDRQELVDSSSWNHYRAALRLVDGGAVRPPSWTPPVLSGEVSDGNLFQTRIDFTSPILLRGSCDCGEARGAKLCRHAVALYLAAVAKQEAADAARRPAATESVGGRRCQAVGRSGNDVVSPMQLDGAMAWLSARLPQRGSRYYDNCRDLLREESFQLDPRAGLWFLRGRHKVLSFLARRWQDLASEGKVMAGNGLKELLKKAVFPKLECDVVASSDGFSVKAEFVASVDGLNAAELVEEAVRQGRNYCECGDRVLLVSPSDINRMEKLRAGIAGSNSEHESYRLRRTIGKAEVPYVGEILEELSPGWKPDAEWQQLSAPLKSLSALRPAPVESSLDDLLRTYQRIGVAWMWHLYGLGLGGILADEMGLGKTVQAVALIGCVLRAEADRTGSDETALPVLVVCPASLIENWCREIRRFAPQLRLVVHHRGNRIDPRENQGAVIVVTSYSTLAADGATFRGTRWAAVIGDEAQHIKNRRTRSAGVLRQLRANGRFLLTGTPVENRIEDLCSLFEFLLPGYIDGAEQEGSGTGGGRRWSRELVCQRAAPYILRRTKSVVAPELPEKIEQTIYCGMEPRQQQIYREFHEQSGRAILDLELGGASEGRVRMEVLRQILRLRQICADPRLIDPSSEASDSAKWNVLRELLEEARDGGHRVLVFSQFVQLLTRVRADLEQAGWKCAYLDGSTRNRMAEVDRFQNDPTIDVFLLSLKAGGSGLNLTAADTVIHLDPWWNPAVEAQATDRAHRIGQTNRVTSLKLIVAGSIEERILALQVDKATLLDEILEAGDATAGALTLDELKGLIG